MDCTQELFEALVIIFSVTACVMIFAAFDKWLNR